MSDQLVTEGDLFAYLDGQELPEVEGALQRSPELQAELAAFRRADGWLERLFAGFVDSQDLVDVVAGQFTPAQQLLVAAYVRRHPEAQAELHALEAEKAAFERQQRPKSGPISEIGPIFRAIRSLAVGLRGEPTDEEQSFYVTELNAEVMLYSGLPTGEVWEIEGDVTRNELPAAKLEVILDRSDDFSRSGPGTTEVVTTVTDEGGFFTFEDLVAGTYQLRVKFDKGILLIPEIILRDE
ncbi:MAG: hypothetical protein ACPGWR_21300 [Ardenticatenaceae bacterium]